MDHDHDTNGTGSESPRVLNDMLRRSALILVFNVKEALGREVLSQAVTGGSLNRTSSTCIRNNLVFPNEINLHHLLFLRTLNVGLDSGGVKTSGKLFLISLASLLDRNCQQIFVGRAVVLQDF